MTLNVSGIGVGLTPRSKSQTTLPFRPQSCLRCQKLDEQEVVKKIGAKAKKRRPSTARQRTSNQSGRRSCRKLLKQKKRLSKSCQQRSKLRLKRKRPSTACPIVRIKINKDKNKKPTERVPTMKKDVHSERMNQRKRPSTAHPLHGSSTHQNDKECLVGELVYGTAHRTNCFDLPEKLAEKLPPPLTANHFSSTHLQSAERLEIKNSFKISSPEPLMKSAQSQSNKNKLRRVFSFPIEKNSGIHVTSFTTAKNPGVHLTEAGLDQLMRDLSDTDCETPKPIDPMEVKVLHHKGKEAISKTTQKQKQTVDKKEDFKMTRQIHFLTEAKEEKPKQPTKRKKKAKRTKYQQAQKILKDILGERRSQPKKSKGKNLLWMTRKIRTIYKREIQTSKSGNLGRAQLNKELARDKEIIQRTLTSNLNYLMLRMDIQGANNGERYKATSSHPMQFECKGLFPRRMYRFNKYKLNS